MASIASGPANVGDGVFSRLGDALTSAPLGTPLATFFSAVALTLVAVDTVDQVARTEAVAEARLNSERVASAIARQTAAYGAVLRSAAVMVEVQSDVPAGLLGRLVRQGSIDRNFRDGLGIGWATRYEPADVDRLIAEQRRAGRTEFNVYPRAPATETLHTAIIRIEPESAANQRAIGYDMTTEPVRREAIERAIASALPSASGTVRLRQDAGAAPRPGFVLYMPVFRGDPATSAERKRQFAGLIYTPFHADAFVRAAHGEGADGAGVAVFDVGDRTRPALLYRSARFAEGDRAAADLVVGGRPWRVETPVAAAAMSTTGRVLLWTGLVVSALLGALVALLVRRLRDARAAMARQREADAIRATLTRELNHRVKNTLANVLSIATLTQRGAKSVPDYVEGLTGRIRALSATHDLLVQSDWAETNVGDVVAAELAPYRDEQRSRISIAGEDIALAPSDALSLGLAIHELATNAAKYGALSVPTGRVDVRWHLSDPTTARLTWVESGGPRVTKPTRKGFGSTLLERIIARELDREIALEHHPDGVRCALDLPVRDRRAFKLRSGAPTG